MSTKDNIVRFLVKITTFASSKDGSLLPIKATEYETAGGNLYTLPDMSLFKDDVTFYIQVEMIARRIYKESSSNVGMVELVTEEEITK